MNKMKEVARMLGVEIGEIFKIENSEDEWYFTENDLMTKRSCVNRPYMMHRLINGEKTIIKIPQATERQEEITKCFDTVNKPKHYVEGRKYEPIDVINDWKLDFNLGNTIKYISRAGRKNNTIEDLEKARFYLDYELKKLKAEDLSSEVDNGSIH